MNLVLKELIRKPRKQEARSRGILVRYDLRNIPDKQNQVKLIKY
jgi:hypothetical protein